MKKIYLLFLALFAYQISVCANNSIEQKARALANLIVADADENLNLVVVGSDRFRWSFKAVATGFGSPIINLVRNAACLKPVDNITLADLAQFCVRSPEETYTSWDTQEDQ